MNNKKTTGAGLAALGAVSGVFCVDTIARDRSVSVLFGGYSYTAPLSAHETGIIFFTLFSVCILAIGLLLFFSKKENPAPKSRREPEEEPLYPLDPPPKFSKLEMKIEEYGVGSCVAGGRLWSVQPGVVFLSFPALGGQLLQYAGLLYHRPRHAVCGRLSCAGQRGGLDL